MDALAGSLAFRLMVLGTDLAADFAEHLRDKDLTVKHLGVLAVVHQGFAGTQDEVAALMRVTPSMVTRFADHLERNGLLERRRDPANRRKHILTVTPAGRKVLAGAGKFASTVDADLTAHTGRAGADHLDTALAALMRRLVAG